jgi:hypothetical protein
MMAHARFAHPPRIAVWLVDLFIPNEQAESIPGDMFEEFTALASTSGFAAARHWYWRQSVKTIAHLIGSEFRVAALSIFGIVLGGYLLLALGGSLPERVIVTVLNLRRHHVNPYYTWSQAQAFLFWFNGVILFGHILLSLVVGCLVATAAKSREMVATIALVLFLCAMTGVGLVGAARANAPILWGMLPWYVVDWFSIVIGGAIIRTRRSASLTPLSTTRI